MKALTLTQPWATLVATGEKRFEPRSWGTKYRGPLAIHAARAFPRHARDLCATWPFAEVLERHGFPSYKHLIGGAVVAVCELADCFRIEDSIHVPDEQELAFGDHTPGRYAWRLDNVRRLWPIELPGHLSLWEIDDAVVYGAPREGAR